MYLLVLIILGVVSVAIIWQLHEYQKREDARADEDGRQDSSSPPFK